MTSATEAVYASLHPKFSGRLLRPADPGYGEARTVWNGMVARKPGLIVRCTTVEDIQAAVRAAHAAIAVTAVRCGGHSLAGHSTCDGGVVIDLSPMRSVAVDQENRRARFSGGCLLGDVDRATQKAGLVFPAGVVSQTGAAGLVLGGGYGWLTRGFGMSCDNVEAFTLVVADGSVVRASAKENEDLFWALRGGGGNFGVVTEFNVKLHPLTSVLFGTGMCVGDDIARVVQYWRDVHAAGPRQLEVELFAAIGPRRRKRSIRHSRTAGRQRIRSLDRRSRNRALRTSITPFPFATPVAVTQDVFAFVDLQTMADWEFPAGHRYYTKSGYMKSLDDERDRLHGRRVVDDPVSHDANRSRIPGRGRRARRSRRNRVR